MASVMMCFSAFIPASFLRPALCDLGRVGSVAFPRAALSGGRLGKVNAPGIVPAAVFSCVVTKRFVMAIISFFDRLSRMSPNWVSRAKTPFFPDMKKAICEDSQTAFCNDCVMKTTFIVLTFLSFLDILWVEGVESSWQPLI